VGGEAVKAGREDAVNALKGELERLRGEVRELALAASRKAEKRPVNRVIEDWKAVGGGGWVLGGTTGPSISSLSLLSIKLPPLPRWPPPAPAATAALPRNFKLGTVRHARSEN
jgi:hypothetical protein